MNQTIECPKCSAAISVPEVKIELVQGQNVSVVICRHSYELNCPDCGANMISQVATADVTMGWKLVPDSQQLITLPESLSRHFH